MAAHEATVNTNVVAYLQLGPEGFVDELGQTSPEDPATCDSRRAPPQSGRRSRIAADLSTDTSLDSRELYD